MLACLLASVREARGAIGGHKQAQAGKRRRADRQQHGKSRSARGADKHLEKHTRHAHTYTDMARQARQMISDEQVASLTKSRD